MYGAGAATEEDAKVEEAKPTAKKVEEAVVAAGATGSGSESEEDTKAAGSKKHQMKMA
jgi:hypothetical protein